VARCGVLTPSCGVSLYGRWWSEGWRGRCWRCCWTWPACDWLKKVKVAHTRLPSVGFRSWFRFLAVSLQVARVINPAVDCHYLPSGPQLPSQPLRGLLPISLLDEQRHDGCEQFAQDCYPTVSRLRFEPGPFCTWVQHANHSATEPPWLATDEKAQD